MSVSFNQIPANWKVPLYWVEVDPSRAGRSVSLMPALLVGTKLSGTAPANIPVAIASADVADGLFGAGSMIARMIKTFLANNPSQLLYAAGVAEPSGGVAATGNIAVSNAPSAAGTLNLYIAGQRVQVAIAATNTVQDVAAAIVAAINANTQLPVTAAQGVSANDHKALLTARWKGASGNDIKLQDNLLGVNGGETMPTGLALTYTAMASGAGAPDMSTLIANLSDDDYKFVAMPYTDTTSLDLWATEYGFSASGRWGYLRQLYGAVYTARRETYANLLTAGGTRNDPTITAMGIEPLVPSPIWEVSAAYCAQAAQALSIDPARPLQTLAFEGIMVAPRGGRFSKTNLNSLAGVGIATQSVNGNGKMAISRESTSYRLNAYSVADDAYELVTTLYTLSSLFERQRQLITSKFPRHKLADNGTRFGPGQAVVTPNIIRGELIAQYSIDEFDGLVENFTAFKANLIVERSTTDRNRVDVLFPPDLINQLRIVGVLAQFRLQYPAVAA